MKVDRIERIVTHPGAAHRDEFVGCCLILAENPTALVERRDPTESDLSDPTTVVLDQGGRHQPDLNNYDHHQLPRSAAPTCALSLVLQRMGIYETALKVFKWLGPTEILDSKGPMAYTDMILDQLEAPKLKNSPRPAPLLSAAFSVLLSTMSPVEASMLHAFSKVSAMDADDLLHKIMVEMGFGWLDYLERFQERLVGLTANRSALVVEGLAFVDATWVPRDEEPVLALNEWVEENDPGAAGTITQDDRGDGYCLFRRNDHPLVDFSRLEGRSDIVFSHKNGFVAKTVAGADYVELLRLAIKN